MKLMVLNIILCCSASATSIFSSICIGITTSIIVVRFIQDQKERRKEKKERETQQALM